MDEDVQSEIGSLKTEVDKLRSDKALLLTAIENIVNKNAMENAETRRLIIENATRLQGEIEARDFDAGQQDILPQGGGDGSAFSIRYRNDTLRASLDLEVSDPPIHRLEWIAQSTAYDPSTITEGNPTGDEWANELWQPVLHGEAVFYTP